MKVGDKRNALTQIGERYTLEGTNKRFAKYLCDCGRVKGIYTSSVITGSTKSCGCQIQKWRHLDFYDDETWRTIENYTNYEVSSYGKVRNILTGQILVEQPCKRSGYIKIGLYSDIRKFRSFPLHRIVAITFIDNPDNLKTVDHIDRDKNNNALSNLKWIDHKGQAINRKSVIRSRRSRSRPVQMLHKDTGKKIQQFNSMLEAGLFCEPDNEHSFKKISAAIRNKVAEYGYRWIYDQVECLQDEIWKQYFQTYYISNMGRVKSKDFILGVDDHVGNRYRGFKITNKFITVHRAVAELFVDNPDKKEIVNHKDGNHLNNHASNLEWVTRSENTTHAVENGLFKNVKNVVHIDLDGSQTTYLSCKHAQRGTGINNSSIYKCCNGKLKQTKNGDRFRYLE